MPSDTKTADAQALQALRDTIAFAEEKLKSLPETNDGFTPMCRQDLGLFIAEAKRALSQLELLAA